MRLALMKMVEKGGLLLLMAALLGVLSCTKEKPALEEGRSIDVNYWKDWIYYSFEKQRTIEVDDPRTDKSWDIGFHITDFRTNGGESGSGLGAAVRTGETDLEASIALHGLQWEADRAGVGIKRGMMKAPDVSVSKNMCLSDAIVWMEGGMPPALHHSENVWLIKDAKGRILKFKVLSFAYEGSTRPRKMQLHFDFVYLKK